MCDYARCEIIVAKYVRPEPKLVDLMTKIVGTAKLTSLCNFVDECFTAATHMPSFTENEVVRSSSLACGEVVRGAETTSHSKLRYFSLVVPRRLFLVPGGNVIR